MSEIAGKSDLALLNERPAPYRRDLRGGDLCYELELLLHRLLPGDVLSIDEGALLHMGGRIDRIVIPRNFSYTTWRALDGRYCIRRDRARW